MSEDNRRAFVGSDNMKTFVGSDGNQKIFVGNVSQGNLEKECLEAYFKSAEIALKENGIRIEKLQMQIRKNHNVEKVLCVIMGLLIGFIINVVFKQ